MDLDKGWYKWLASNCARGVDRFDLYRDMVRAGFGHHLTVQALDRAFTNRTQRHLQLTCNLESDLQLIDDDLPLIRIDNFLTLEQCRTVSRCAQGHLQAAEVTGNLDIENFRTNRTFHIHRNQTKELQRIDAQINRLVGLTNDYSEPLQVQVYDKGEQFQLHTDYFEY